MKFLSPIKIQGLPLLVTFSLTTLFFQGCVERSPHAVSSKPSSYSSSEKSQKGNSNSAHNISQINAVCIRPIKIDPSVVGLSQDFVDGLFEKAVIAQLQLTIHPLHDQKKHDCTNILSGTLSHYQERSGSAYGSEKTAEVSLILSITDIKSRSILWSDEFNYKDTPLSEDIITFFKNASSKGTPAFGKASWVLEYGFNSLLEAFQKKREQSFLK